MPQSVQFETFRLSFQCWETLFREAANFAASVGRDLLIGISHSADEHEDVVTVWYWQGDEQSSA
jgi:hypothetical protein